jgi:hypothetical protein
VRSAVADASGPTDSIRGSVLHTLALLDIDWKSDLTAGDAVVGFGTLLLAVGTFSLAWITRRDVASTERELALTKQSVDALDMPYVIGVPNPKLGGGIVLDEKLRIRLWNIGKGPALVEAVSLSSIAEPFQLIAEPFLTAELPIQAGEVRDEEFDAESGVRAGIRVLRITYRHSNGERYETCSEVEIDGGNQQVRCVTYRREGPGSPNPPRRRFAHRVWAGLRAAFRGR